MNERYVETHYIEDIKKKWKIKINQTWWEIESIIPVTSGGFNLIIKANFKGRIKLFIEKETQWLVKY